MPERAKGETDRGRERAKGEGEQGKGEGREAGVGGGNWEVEEVISSDTAEIPTVTIAELVP